MTVARFRFKLEPVLRQRTLAERDEQLRVAHIERERIDLENRLRAQQAVIENESQELGSMTLGGRVPATTLRNQGVALAAARSEAQQLAVQLAGVLKRLETARAKLAEKAAERRAIELLKERRLEAFQREQDVREAAVLDDLATSAATRKSES